MHFRNSLFHRGHYKSAPYPSGCPTHPAILAAKTKTMNAFPDGETCTRTQIGRPRVLVREWVFGPHAFFLSAINRRMKIRGFMLAPYLPRISCILRSRLLGQNQKFLKRDASPPAVCIGTLGTLVRFSQRKPCSESAVRMRNSKFELSPATLFTGGDNCLFDFQKLENRGVFGVNN